MIFYVIQLFNVEYKDDMILAMTSAGLLQGTCVEGDNLDKLLNNDFPIFKGLFKMKEDKELASFIFFGFSKRENIEGLSQVLKDAGIENSEDEQIYKIAAIQAEEI